MGEGLKRLTEPILREITRRGGSNGFNLPADWQTIAGFAKSMRDNPNFELLLDLDLKTGLFVVTLKQVKKGGEKQNEEHITKVS